MELSDNIVESSLGENGARKLKKHFQNKGLCSQVVDPSSEPLYATRTLRSLKVNGRLRIARLMMSNPFRHLRPHQEVDDL
jgi:hypothetical protein